MHISGTERPQLGVIFILCIGTSIMILKVAMRGNEVTFIAVIWSKFGKILFTFFSSEHYVETARIIFFWLAEA